MAVSIAVPQQDGDIRIAHNGDGQSIYVVGKGPKGQGLVTVEEVDAAAFLALVPGSSVVPTKAADAPKAS